MKKIIAAFITSFFITVTFASSCPVALPTTHPNFCTTFVAAGTCYCANSLPKRMCLSMDQIHQRMLSMFGSIERACAFQRETPTQTCIDDWHCYLQGGKDSKGGACSGSGKSCV